MAEFILRPPPRLSGETTEVQISNINNYLDDLFRASQLALEVIDAIGTLGPLAVEISNPPTQAEVVAIRDAVNTIILMASRVEL